MEAVFVQKPFVSQISNDTDAQLKAKITRHGKKKNDKDETGNVLLNLRCFYLSITYDKNGTSPSLGPHMCLLGDGHLILRVIWNLLLKNKYSGQV